MQVSLRRRSAFVGFALAIFWLCQPQRAVAQTVTWLGGSNVSWATIGNWTSGSVPGTGNTVVYGTASGNLANQVLGANRSIFGLTVGTVSGPVSVAAGNTLTIGGGGVNMAAATNDVTVAALALTSTTNANITIANGRTLTSSAGMNYVTGTWTFDGQGAFSVGSGNTFLDGSGGQPSAFVVKSGSVSVNPGGNSFILAYGGTSASGLIDVQGGYMNAAKTEIGRNGTASVKVSGGTLAIGNFSAFASGTNSVGSILLTGGTLALGSSMPSTRGAGATTTVTLDGGVLQAGAAGLTLVQNVTNAYVTNNGAFVDSNSFSTTIAQALVNGTAPGTAGSLTKLNSGTLALTAANTYSGTTFINAGILQLGSGSTTGSLNTASVITGSAGAQLGFNRTNTVTQGIDFANTVGSAVGLAQLGSGTVILNGSNSYTGVTTFGAGVLSLASADALAGGGNLRFTGGSLQYTGSNQLDYSARIASSTSAISIDTNSQAVSWGTPLAATNTGGLTKLGSGTLTITGSNLYSGSTTVSGGVLRIGSAGTSSLGTTSALVMNSGTLDLGGVSTTVTSLSGSAGSVVLTNGGPATLTASQATTGTFGGALQDGTGVLSFTRFGTAGTLALTGSNSYTGATTVSSGTLQLSGAAGRIAATSGVTVSGGSLLVGDATAATNSGVANRINPSAVLTLGGTTFGAGSYTQYAPAASGTHSQSLAGLAIRMGASSIAASGATGTNTLTFTGSAATNYTKATGGSVDISTATGFGLSFSSQPSVAVGAGSNAILPGATISLNDLVGFSGAGPVTAGTATYVANTWASGSNVNVTASLTPGSAATVNSLRLSTATSSTLTLTGQNPISSGMILYGTSAGVASVITGGTLTSGYVNSSGAGELMIFNRNAVDARSGPTGFTINSTIADNGATSVALTLTGSGVIQPIYTGASVVALGGTNTYTGPTTLSGVQVQFSADTAFGAANTLRVTSGGGWLRPTVAAYTWNASRPIDLANGTLTLSTSGTFTVPAVISGSGAIAMGSLNGYSGVVALTGSNTFTGFFEPGTYVQAADGVGLPTAANLRFIGNTAANSSLLTSGTFTRSIGTGPGQVQWNTDPLINNNSYASGGFSAYGGPLIVALGGTAAPDTFTWGSSGVVASAALNLQSTYADSPLTWLNPINLGSGTRTIVVTGSQTAEIAGVISNGGLTVGGAGAMYSGFRDAAGTLILSASNTYAGKTSVWLGMVQVSSINSVGTGTPSNLGAPMNATAGTIDLGGVNATTGSGFVGGLTYTGTGETTDRIVNLSGTGNSASFPLGGILDQSGASGTLRFTGAMTSSGTGFKTITLRGSTAGIGEFAGSIGSFVNGSGTVALTKAGTGLWVLSGSNTYTGTTSINAGTLQIGGGGSTGSLATASAITGSAGTMLAFNRTDMVASGSDFASTIGGAINVAQIGSGTLVLNGVNTYTGTTSLVAGVIRLGDPSAITSSILDTRSGAAGTLSFGVLTSATLGRLTGSNGIELDNDSNQAVALAVGGGNASSSFTGGFSGIGSLVKVGTGTLLLSGSASHTGGTVVTSGSLVVGNAAALGAQSGAITVSGGVLDLGGYALTRTGAVSFLGGTTQSGTITNDTVAFDAQAGTVAGTLAGSAGLVKTSSGTATLAAANTYTGTTAINAGVLALGPSTALGGGGNLTFGGGSLQYSAVNTVDYSGRIKSSGSAISIDTNSQSVTFASALDSTNTAGLTKLGSGTLTLSGSNSYTGVTTVAAGSLVVANASALSGPSTPIVAAGGVLDLGGYSLTRTGSVSFTGGTVRSGTITNNTVAFDGQAGTVAAVLAGSVGLTKTGTGELFLTAVNTYTGVTQVNGGFVNIWDTSNLGAASNSVTLNGGGLELGATYVGNAVTIGVSGGTIGVARNFTATNANAGLTGSGTLAIAGGGTLRMVEANSAFTGAVAIANDGGALSLRDAGTLTGVSRFTVNPGGTLTLDDTGSTNVVSRISTSSTVALPGGGLTFLARNSAGNSSATVGTVDVSAVAGVAGAATITATRAGQGANLTIGNLIRGTGASTVNFAGTTFSGASSGDISRVFLTQINGAAVTGSSWLGGWATVSGTDFAAYVTPSGGGGGVVVPGSAGAPSYTTLTAASAAGSGGWAASNVGDLGSTTGTMTLGVAGTGQNFSLLALRTGTGAAAATISFAGTTGTPDTLYVANGGVIHANAQPRNIGASGGTTYSKGRLTAGDAGLAGTVPVDLLLHSAGNSTTNQLFINSQIIDNPGGGGHPLTVIARGGFIQLSSSNSYSGGTQVITSQMIASVAGSLGTGKVYVNNSGALTLSATAASTYAGSLADPTYTVVNNGLIATPNAVRASSEFIAVDANSALSLGGTTGAASWDIGTNLALAPGATIVASTLQAGEALKRDGGQALTTLTTPTWYWGLNTNHSSVTGTIGPGTPWLGISHARQGTSGWQIASGTITANGDFQLRSNFSGPVILGNNTNSTLVFATNRPTQALVVAAGNSTSAVNLATTNASYGSNENPLTFVVTPGATLQGVVAGGMGVTGSTASVVAQNGGTITFTVANAFNGAVTMLGGSRLQANNASGLTGTGQLTFENGSIIDIITQPNGFSGSQATAATINPGTIVRLGVASITNGATGPVDAILGGKAGVTGVIYEQGVGTLANPTSAATLLTLNKSVDGVGGILTNDASNRTLSAATGAIVVGGNGGGIAASAGTLYTVTENIDLGANELQIGYPGSIAGLLKTGTVTLNASAVLNSGLSGSRINILAGATVNTAGNTVPTVTSVNADGAWGITGSGVTTIAGLTGSGTIGNNTSVQTATLTIQGSGSQSIFNGIISGSWGGVAAPQGVTLSGSADQVFAGANTYTGVTTVSGGILRVGTIGNGGVASNLGAATTAAANIVLSGGTLQYTGLTASSNRSFTLTTGSTGTIDIANAATTFTFSGTSAATTGALVKTGAGTLALTGSNGHTGGTTVASGTLLANGAGALPSNRTITVVDGTLDVNVAQAPGLVTLSGNGSIVGSATLTGTAYAVTNASGTATIGATLAGTNATFTKTGAGLVALAGNNTFTGQTTAGEGTIIVDRILNSGSASPLGTSGTVGLGSGAINGTLRYTGSGETTTRVFNLAGSAGGGGAIEANGTGALRLLRSGTVVTGAAGNKMLTLSGTSLADNEIGLIGNPSSGTTSLVKSGPGRWVLSGSNTFSGDVSVNEGQLVLAVDASASTGSLGTFANAAITIGSASGSGTAALLLKSGVNIDTRTFTIPQTASGSQAIVIGAVDGSGTATFLATGSTAIAIGRDVTLQAATNGTIVFNNAWTQATGTNVSVTVGSAGNAGTVVLGKSLAATGTVRIDRGTLRLATVQSSTGSLASASSIVIGPANGDAAFLDVRDLTSFAVPLAQTLSGTGTLRLDADTPVSIAGTFRPGNSPGIFTFDGSGTTTLAGTTVMEITGTLAGSGYDQVRFSSAGILNYGSGSLQLELSGIYADNTEFDLFDFSTTASGSFTTVSGAGSYGLLNFTRGSNGVWTSGTTTVPNQSFEFRESTGTLVIVPEPAALALAAFGIGLAGWVACRRRR